jgi:hypothetical protein
MTRTYSALSENANPCVRHSPYRTGGGSKIPLDNVTRIFYT